MKKLPFLALTAAIAATVTIGCDRTDRASKSTTDHRVAGAQPADTNPAPMADPALPGLNPGSATGAGQNSGATASNTNPVVPPSTADNTHLARGSAAVSDSGAPGVNPNTGTTLNPHYIEDNAQPAAAAYSLTPQQFVDQAASGGMFEVESSKLALERSNDPSIKDFAQQMIHDHEKANEELKKIAQSENIRVPSSLLPKEQQLYDRLKKSSSDFDKQYAQMQKQAHEETVMLFQTVARSMSDLPLKNFAAGTLPTLQEHLEHANRLRQ